MELKDYSTIELIKELEGRNEVEIYDCGPYHKHEGQIKRKYTNNRGFVELPDNYVLLLITK